MSSLRSLHKLRPFLAHVRTIRCKRYEYIVCMVHCLFTMDIRLSCSSVDPLPTPQADSNNEYPEKITRIAEDISKLTLLETAQLNELLKVTILAMVHSVLSLVHPL